MKLIDILEAIWITKLEWIVFKTNIQIDELNDFRSIWTCLI